MLAPGRLALILALVAGGSAAAQPSTVDPVDPYAAAAPPPSDDVVIAQALVARARQLLDADFPADAKQLAMEALIRVSDGDAAVEAKAIIEEADRRLGAVAPVAPPEHPDPVVTPPPQTDLDRPPTPSDPLRDGRRWLALHGSLIGASAAGGIGLAASGDSAAVTAIAAAGGAAIGFYAGGWAAKRWKLDQAQARTIGSGATVGAVTVGLFADVLDVGGTTPGEIGLGVAIGTAAGTAAGAMIARADRLTPGDVALMDSFAMYGVLGGLTLGAAMQPAKTEAYSLNAVIGGVGGWLVGAGLGSRIDASPRRVGRMVLGAVALGGAPWLLYLAIKDDSTNNDEQAIGFVSTVGIVGGAYLGYRLSRRLAGEELDAHGHRVSSDPGAIGLVRRSSGGGWTLAPALPRPASVDGRRAWMLDLAGGAF